MATNLSKPQPQSDTVSTGSGIAIAGVWLGASAITIVLLLITFVWAKQPLTNANEIKHMSDDAWIGLFILFASPMIAAYWATKRILGQHDDL